MKTAGMWLDLKNDSCRIFGRYIELQSMMSAHFSLPLTNMLLEVERLENVVQHYKALKMFKSGEKKEGWEIT